MKTNDFQDQSPIEVLSDKGAIMSLNETSMLQFLATDCQKL
jgi:hypothetical protein